MTAKSSAMTPYDIIDTVNKKMPDDAIIVTDVGQHQMWVAQRYKFEKPRTFISSGGLGTMGLDVYKRQVYHNKVLNNKLTFSFRYTFQTLRRRPRQKQSFRRSNK